MTQIQFGMNLKELEKSADAKQLHTMHLRHGVTEGRSCGECVHLIERRHDKTYFKCDLYRIASSAATDWRKKWQACGRFESNS